MRVRTCAALFAVLLLALPAAAQEQTGSIVGVVRDASGGVLPGATVEARSPSTVGVSVSVSDAQGVYRFPALPPGTYAVSGKLQGFVAAAAEAVVTLGKQLTIDLTLKVAGVAETVTVTAESPVIDTKANAATASVDAKMIELIPKGRGLISLLTQIPGTNNEARGGGLMIDGASGSENRYLVDGVDRTNARTGTAFAISGTEIVVQDFVETVQVKQSGYNAEYRAALGGVVNTVTKSGSDQFHGNVGSYYTDNRWLGDIRNTLRAVPTNAALAESVKIPRDKSHQTDIVLSLGGPVLRDKAWFFVGYAPQYYPAERTIRWATPGAFTPTQTFKDSEGAVPNNKALNFNVTSQLANRLRSRFTGNRETQKGALTLPNIQPDGTSTSSAATFNPRSQLYTEQFQNAYSGTLDWTATDRTFVSVVAGYLGYGSHQAGGDYFHGTRRTFSTTNVNFLDVPASFQNVSGFAENNANSFTTQDDYKRFDLTVDLTRFMGKHTVKIGGLYERIGNFVELGQQHVNIAFNWNAVYSTTSNTPASGKYGYFEARRTYTDGDINETNFSFFAQDAWAVSSNLTVNYGMRLEKEEIPSYNPNAPGVNFGWGSKIAPRAGFAYDVKGDGKWKAYGSYGLFYDTMKLEMPRGAWGGEKWISYYYTLDTFDWKSIDCKGPNGEGGCNGGTFIESVNFRHTSNEPGSLIGQVDPNLEPTRKHEYTLGLDRELRANMSAGVRYVRKGWDQTIDDIGVCAKGSQVCGEVYNIANPGQGIGKTPIEGPYPSVPKVVNIYDGLEFVLRKRYSHNWQATSSIVFSRLYGNYGGLASSDENGRNSPNVSRYYDSLFLSFTQKGEEAIGRLNTDRPIQFKLQGAYTMPWGTNLGLNFFAQSGLLQSSTVSYQAVPIYFNGRGDLGRMPMLNQTDLLVSHDIKIHGMSRLSLMVNVTNLFDQATATRLAFSAYRDALVIPGFTNRPADAFFQPGGFNTLALQSARLPASGRPSPTYNQPDQFQSARSIRVMAGIRF